jgi:hypothetical protein
MFVWKMMIVESVRKSAEPAMSASVGRDVNKVASHRKQL